MMRSCAVLALAVVALAAVAFARPGATVAVRAAGGFENYNPYLALDVDPTTGILHTAFSPTSQGDDTRHYGLEIRQCTGVNGTTNCATSNTFALGDLVIPCSSTAADGWVNNVVQDIQLQISSQSRAAFTYVAYTAWSETFTDSDPNANVLVLLYCNMSDCSAGASSITITPNGYSPSLALVKASILGGAPLPALSYVTNQAIVTPVPSSEYVGNAYLLFCGDQLCTQQQQKLMQVDTCMGSGNVSLCSQTSLTIDSNGCPQMAYMGPSATQAGTWLKVASCKDTSAIGCACQSVSFNEIAQVDTRISAYPGNVQIFTRSAGHPAVVYTTQLAANILYMARCSDYVCALANVTIATLFTGSTNQVVMNPSVTVLDNNLPVVVFNVATLGGLEIKHDMYVVYCDKANCVNPPAATLISQSSQQPVYPTVAMLPDSQLAIAYFDEASVDGYLLVCDNNQCSPNEISNAQQMNTEDILCFPQYPPAPSGGSHSSKKGANGGAIAAGVILAIVALGGVGVFAYWFIVVRPGGKWPWSSLQAKGLDQYAEL